MNTHFPLESFHVDPSDVSQTDANSIPQGYYSDPADVHPTIEETMAEADSIPQGCYADPATGYYGTAEEHRNLDVVIRKIILEKHISYEAAAAIAYMCTHGCCRWRTDDVSKLLSVAHSPHSHIFDWKRVHRGRLEMRKCVAQFFIDHPR